MVALRPTKMNTFESHLHAQTSLALGRSSWRCSQGDSSDAASGYCRNLLLRISLLLLLASAACCRCDAVVRTAPTRTLTARSRRTWWCRRRATVSGCLRACGLLLHVSHVAWSLGASRPVPQHVQDRHHVVSVRRPTVRNEVRLVDVRLERYRPAAEGQQQRRHDQFHSQRRMASHRYVPRPLTDSLSDRHMSFRLCLFGMMVSPSRESLSNHAAARQLYAQIEAWCSKLSVQDSELEPRQAQRLVFQIFRQTYM